MITPGKTCAPLLLAVACASLGCGPSEQDARSYLDSQGYAVVEVKKSDGAFEFTATKGKDLCHGTLSIKKSFGGSSQSMNTTCELDTSACKPGAVDDCLKIADELYNKEEKVFPTKAAALYRTACADKNGRACARVAEFEAIDKHWDKVRDFAKQGCDLDDGDGCRRLARTEFDGLGTAKNEPNALDLFKKGCGLSSLPACRGVAGLLLDRSPSDAQGALPFAEKLCAAKSPDGCYLTAMSLFELKQDYTRALGYFDAECQDQKSSFRGPACNYAGAVTGEGIGMPKDPKRGLGYFAKACELDNANGCRNSALYYRKGSGAPRDAKKATDLFAKACKLGNKDACAAK